MPRHERGVEGFARIVEASGDHSQRLHTRCVQAIEIAQGLVLVVRDGLADLLHGHHLAVQMGEAHDVPRDTARERGDDVGGPLLEWGRPRQIEQRGLYLRRRDLQRSNHDTSLPLKDYDAGALLANLSPGVVIK